jgi:hypothetical protein
LAEARELLSLFFIWKEDNMSITKLTANLNNHQSLPDEPDNALYTPEDLKILFDKAPNDVKDYINNILIPQLESTIGISGAELIGSKTIAGLNGNTVWEQISNLLLVAQQAQSGSIIPGSITDSLLSNSDGQIKSKVAALDQTSKAIVASGTGTAITLTVPEISNYEALQKITFIASANNNGNLTTIAFNNLDAKPLYKINSTVSPVLVKDKPYTVILNKGATSFFLVASAEGNASVNHVLAGKTFSNDIDTGIQGKLQTMVEGTSFTVASTLVSKQINENLVKYYEFTANLPGRVTALSTTGTMFDINTVTLEIWKNSNVVATQTWTGVNGNVGISADIEVEVGDKISIYAKNTTGATVSLSNFFIKTSNPLGGVMTIS